MSKIHDEDIDYFSEDDDNDSLSEDVKSEVSKEEQINQKEQPEYYEEEEDEDQDEDEENHGKDIIKKIKKVQNFNNDYEDEDEKEIFNDHDDFDNDYDDDDAEDEEQMNSTIRHGGASSTSLDLESSLHKNNDDESMDDDDEETNDNYLQKFDYEINKNYVVDFHPECFVHNYEEINAFTKIVRDVNNNIIDPLHKTLPFLTKYEKARLVGIRAKQINTGAKPFVSVPENIIDGYLIAELELKEKRLPFIIKRPLAGGSCEYWKIQDLEMIGF